MNDELQDLLVKRELAERTMQNADPALQRALALVGQPLNPAEVVDAAGLKEHYRRFAPEVTEHSLDFSAKNVGAFRYPKAVDPRIFVNAGSKLYRDANERPKDPLAQLSLARTLVHEQIHNTEWGAEGEAAAKRKEADWYREQIKSLPRHLRVRANEELQVLEMRARTAAEAARRMRK